MALVKVLVVLTALHQCWAGGGGGGGGEWGSAVLGVGDSAGEGPDAL